MANPDARFGFRPVRHISGAPWNGATIRCYVSASYATALFIGDAVTPDTTIGDLPTAGKCPTLKVAGLADTNYILGVITSFEPNPDNLSQQYRPASQARYCNVCVDPTVVYQIRGDGAGIPPKQTVMSNATGVTTHAGDTITGLSGMELAETASPAANSSYPLLVIGVADIEDNAFDGTSDIHVIWEVLISTSLFGGSGSDYGLMGVTAA